MVPSSPATNSPPGGTAAVHPAVAAQAEHRRATAEFRAHRAADQQARITILVDEAIAAFASLLGQPGPHPRQDA